MSDHGDIAAFLDLGWQRLTRGVADRRAAARHPAFATVSPDGLPEARTVVLRGASRSDGTVEVHTDGGSDKIASLKANPHAQLMIWDEKPKLQIRLSTRVTIRHLPSRLAPPQATPAHWPNAPPPMPHPSA